MHHIPFANTLTKLRKEKNGTQQQLADYLGVTRAAVSKWEKGSSYPDITHLPKIATYFNTTIDALLNYEPQLSNENILELYTQYANAFFSQPFEDVFKTIAQQVDTYRSCYPFLLKMAQLLLNYFPKSTQPEESASFIHFLVQEVQQNSTNVTAIQEARSLEALLYMMQQQPKKTLALLGEEPRIQLNEEALIAKAHLQLGNIPKSLQTIQATMFQYVFLLTASLTESMLLHTQDVEKFQQLTSRNEALIELFQLSTININQALIFHGQAAIGFATLQHEEEMMHHLSKYVALCTELRMPITINGDDFFYLIDDWIKENMMLATVTPRDEQSIRQDLLQLFQHPAFVPYMENKSFLHYKIKLEKVIR